MDPTVPGYEIVYLGGDDGFIQLNGLGLESFDALEDAWRVFGSVIIRPSREEHVWWIVIHDKQVVGAATFAYQEEAETQAFRFTFSLALLPAHQQKGLGRKLVEAAVAEARSLDPHGYFRVWVVNPHLARLLERMGFSTENSSGWTENAPHMYLYL
jgi:GNAT superfamily N-acetyltransferase